MLVVDDDDSIREIVTEVLELEGYPVRSVGDGAQALHVIQELRSGGANCPKLVLLDMRMPVLNGWDVARELAARQINLPIIVMTAARDAQVWAEQIGADGYLAKPFGIDDLLATVASVVGQAG